MKLGGTFSQGFLWANQPHLVRTVLFRASVGLHSVLSKCVHGTQPGGWPSGNPAPPHGAGNKRREGKPEQKTGAYRHGNLT